MTGTHHPADKRTVERPCACGRSPNPGLCGTPATPCVEGWTHGSHCPCCHLPDAPLRKPPKTTQAWAWALTITAALWLTAGAALTWRVQR